MPPTLPEIMPDPMPRTIYIYPDGRVELGPGVALDEASKIFWASARQAGFRFAGSALRSELIALVAVWSARDSRDLSAGAMLAELRSLLDRHA